MLSHATRTVGRTVASRRVLPALGQAQLLRRNYHENIVEHYENPRNVGSLDKNETSVGTVSFRSPIFAPLPVEQGPVRRRAVGFAKRKLWWMISEVFCLADDPYD